MSATFHPHKSTEVPEKFFHIRDENDVLFATVFARLEGETDSKPGTWWCSFSMCHPNDQFSRRIGRNVARRKYFQGDCVEIMSKEEPSYGSAQEILYTYFIEEEGEA